MRKIKFLALVAIIFAGLSQARGQTIPYTDAWMASVNYNTVYPCGYLGGTATAQIQGALNQIVYRGGGTIDLTCYMTALTITSDIFSAVTSAPIKIILPEHTVTISANVTFPANMTFVYGPSSALAAGPGYVLTFSSTAERSATGFQQLDLGIPVAPVLAGDVGGTLLGLHTYFYCVTSIPASGGETQCGPINSVLLTALQNAVDVSWTADSNASLYAIYRSTTGAAPWKRFTSATNSFTDVGAAGTSVNPPTTNTAWVAVSGGGGGGTVFNVSSGAGLTGGPITTTGTLSIASGGVTNTMLVNSAVTVNGQTCTLGSTCDVNSGATSGTLAINNGAGAALTAYAGATTCVSGGQAVQSITASGGVTCYTPSASSTAWDDITNPAGNMSLSLGAKTSVFSYTTPGGAFGATLWSWYNSTAATAIASADSPRLGLVGNYWTGSASANDLWEVGSLIGTGANGSSTLVFSNGGAPFGGSAGTSGQVAVEVPNLINLGSTQYGVQLGGGSSGVITSTAVGATNTVLNGNTGAAPTFGAVPNTALAHSATTVNGQTCTLGSTCDVNSGATSGTLALNAGAGAALTAYAGATTCVSGGQAVQSITSSGGVTCFTPSGSATAWNSISNPTGNALLSMGTDTSEFDYTTAGGAFGAPLWIWANKTAATVGTPQNSPRIELSGNYWATGAVSSPDYWEIGSLLGAGLNGSSTLTFSYEGAAFGGGGGTSGTVAVSVPHVIDLSSTQYGVVYGGGSAVEGSTSAPSTNGFYFTGYNITGSAAAAPVNTLSNSLPAGTALASQDSMTPTMTFSPTGGVVFSGTSLLSTSGAGANAISVLNVQGVVGQATSGAGQYAGVGSSPSIVAGKGGNGTGATSIGATGGSIYLTSGDGGTSGASAASSDGGSVIVSLGEGGTGTTGPVYGEFVVQGNTTVPSQTGGGYPIQNIFEVRGVTGGATTGSGQAGGTGSSAIINGGQGGPGSGGTNSEGGVGGNVTLAAGPGGVGGGTANNNNGGAVYLEPGAAGSGGSGTSGAVGSIYMQAAGVFNAYLKNTTSGAIANSPAFVWSGAYQSGGSSWAADTWTAYAAEGSGTNGTSVLTVSHAGTSGSTAVSVPALSTASILDTNLNPALAITATASAVDGLTVTNAATGTPATVNLAGSGSDSGVGVTLQSKNASFNGTLGKVTVQGGNETGTGGSSSSAGEVLVAGGTNAATASGSQAGSVELLPGYNTTSTAGAEQGVMILGQFFKQGTGSFNQWTLSCQDASTAQEADDCGASPAAILGVTDQHTGNVVQVHVPPSITPALIHGTSTPGLGHTLCAGTSATVLTDSGGTTPCTTGFTAGEVIAVTGQWNLADGSSATLGISGSNYLALIQLYSLHQFGAGDVVGTLTNNTSGNAATATALASYTGYSVYGSSASAGAWITPTANGLCLMSAASSYATTTPSFQICPSGFANPMTTLGDLIYENATPAAAKLSGPTTPASVPQYLTSTPSGGVAAAPAWALAGVPVDSQSGSTYTIVATDRTNLVNTTNNTTSTAVTIPQANTTGFTSNFPFVHCNSGTVIATDTPTTSTVNGNTTIKLVPFASGNNPECAFIWSDNTNYYAAEILPTDANGRLQALGMPAFTGDMTTSAGSLATTVGKVNGVTYGASPSTNTVAVVTGTNATTYEALPVAALASDATTVNSQTCTLGSSCTVNPPLDKSTNGLANPTQDVTFQYPNTSTTGFTLSGVVPVSSASTGTNATTLFNIDGVAGGATSGTTGQSGGTGSAPTITAGNGGNATGAGTTSTTGGQGGNLQFEAGSGGNGNAGNDSGGGGGNILLIAGAGGSKSGSGTAGATGFIDMEGLAGAIANIYVFGGTGSAVSNSSILTFEGFYEATAGPTYTYDQWNVQNVVGAGVNGTSTLTFTHSGTSGTVGVNFPAGSVALAGLASTTTTVNTVACTLGGSTCIVNPPLDESTYGLANPTADAIFTYPSTSTNGFTLAGTAPASSSGATGTNATTLFNVNGVTGGADSNATGTAGNGSNPSITAGTGGAGTGTNAVGGQGGSISLSSGNGGNSNGTGGNSDGGNINLQLGVGGSGGSGNAPINGTVYIQSNGTPLPSSTAGGYNAGDLFYVYGFAGGNTTGTSQTAGQGTSSHIYGGPGGSGAGGTNSSGGPGGYIYFIGGNGGASGGTAANSNGGNVVLTPGSPGTGGSGAAGTLGSVNLSAAGLFNINFTNTTSTAVANSPTTIWKGEYEATSGPTYAADTWSAQDVVGAGVNGTSTLTLTHSGSTGAATVSLPSMTSTGTITASSDGTHAGLDSEVGNTTVPTSLPANSTGWLGPNSASFTSYFFQPSATAPAAAGPMLVGTTASNVTQVTYGTLSGTGTVFPTTAAPTITNPLLNVNSSLSASQGTGLYLPGSFTAGEIYYMASGGLTAAEANASSTVPAVCIAISTTQCAISGVFKFSGSQSWTAGQILYTSDAGAGAILNSAPTTSAHYVQRIGVALANDTILFMPSLDVGTIQ
jgi:hypothetical protein